MKKNTKSRSESWSYDVNVIIGLANRNDHPSVSELRQVLDDIISTGEINHEALKKALETIKTAKPWEPEDPFKGRARFDSASRISGREIDENHEPERDESINATVNGLWVGRGEQIFLEKELLRWRESLIYREDQIYLLIQSLEKADLKKLKKCEWCENYYLAKTRRKQKYCPVCSPKSKMTREERRKYMAERRAKEKKERDLKIAPIKKKYIENLIASGLSEKEAKKEWEQHKRESKL